MQPRFERRSGSSVFSLIEQPRYRAGFDFLRLRADVGEVDGALADWWEDFALGTDDEREALLEDAREKDKRRGPKTQSQPRKPAAAAAPKAEAEGEGEEGGALDGAAPAKKRRRRRKPGGARKSEGGGTPTPQE